MKKRIILVLSIFLLLAVVALPTNALPGEATVEGVVRANSSTGPYLQGVKVSLIYSGDVEDTDYTDSYGAYEVSFWPDYNCYVLLKFEKSGYQTKVLSKYVKTGQTVYKDTYLLAPDTTPPAQVTGLTATTASTTSITLHWNQNTEADMHHYDIYCYDYIDHRYEMIGTTTKDVTTYTASTINGVSFIPDAWYSFKVRAIDKTGNVGSFSSIASATTGYPSGTASLSICNIKADEIVPNSFPVVARVTVPFATIVCQINSGTEYSMSRIGISDHYQYEFSGAPTGSRMTLRVTIRNSAGTTINSQQITIEITNEILYSMTIEVDCIVGQTPGSGVLADVEDFYESMGIAITFNIDDTNIPDPTPTDGYITDSDFDAIRQSYYDGDIRYNSPNKYLLYCNYHPTGAKGYTACDVNDVTNEINGGNCIRIFKAKCVDFENLLAVTNHGAEVDVLIHEIAHAIGIGIMNAGGEDYGTDRYNCMNWCLLENSKLMNNYWYIDGYYWAQRNFGLS